ncbi:unnamed protein product [Callosobruchus maculatus]|uniref:Kinesin-like protein n=2 Tax=Callosobruchus maculatus TaxID=64391 RepID=A0A653D177_CALMS|nr:unnamed protein product [Callosobruchus maculatus]
MAENVKVIVRCRPMNKREIDLNCQCVVSVKNCVVEAWDPHEGPCFPKQFTFDSTYDQDSTTEVIYNDICYPLVESVLEGYNATIFVYGQTGCGKSFTMEGVKDNIAQKGVISRAFEHIFEAISVTSGIKYLALVSYLEIYNEHIRDLLLTSEKLNGTPLTLKESPCEGVTVPGLTTHPVHNAAECEHLLNLGSKNRMIGATLMNQNSSRSHSIFTISIEQISKVNNNECIMKGKLNLVDLAGSERQTKTGATGERLREATKINLSLSALGNVISALVDGKAKHIPYRDSKLTRLLQDSLGGNTKTLMIACISPSSRDYMETLSTLRYANRAKNIHNKPKINEDPKDAILRQYQEEIDRLKALLQDNQTKQLPDDLKFIPCSEINQNLQSRNSELDAKRDRLLQEYQEEMKKLKNLHESEKQEKESILKQIEAIKEEYNRNIKKLNEEIEEKGRKELCSQEEILNRIEALKAAMIGGERANDKELSERRKRKKMEAEKRARELLHNQYKDISQELSLKTDALRKYRHKVKVLEKEISDIQSEFESERQDYLEAIRKQDRQVKLFTQISEKLAGNLRKEYESQKYKLPELIVIRTRLPPPGQSTQSESCFFNEEKLQSVDGSIVDTYFQPTMKRANELLNQSSKVDPHKVINTWRDFTKRKSPDNLSNPLSPASSSNSPKTGILNNGWTNGSPTNESFIKKPFRLEALPNIVKNRKQRLNTLELL